MTAGLFTALTKESMDDGSMALGLLTAVTNESMDDSSMTAVTK